MKPNVCSSVRPELQTPRADSSIWIDGPDEAGARHSEALTATRVDPKDWQELNKLGKLEDYHRITEYADLEGTHKDYGAQLLGLHRTAKDSHHVRESMRGSNSGKDKKA